MSKRRCCCGCVYGVRPEGRWLRVILRRWPGLWICFNHVDDPGRMREVVAEDVCRNFRARRRPRGKRVPPPEPPGD